MPGACIFRRRRGGLSPDTLEVQAGQAALLRVSNVGRTPHERVLRFAQPGRFEMACLVPGHYEAGMRGSLAVVPASGAALKQLGKLKLGRFHLRQQRLDHSIARHALRGDRQAQGCHHLASGCVQGHCDRA